MAMNKEYISLNDQVIVTSDSGEITKRENSVNIQQILEVENKKIYIDKIPYVISIIKALNETSEGDKWITMGITIPFNMLKINGVKFLKFSFR